jgi:hypothetical protein
MKNDNKSIQDIIDRMSVGQRKYEEKKSLKKGFKSLEDSILQGLKIKEVSSDMKKQNNKSLVQEVKKKIVKTKEDEAIWKQTKKNKPSLNSFSFGKSNNKTTNILKNRKVGGGS